MQPRQVSSYVAPPYSLTNVYAARMSAMAAAKRLGDLSSKPTARRCMLLSIDGTDMQTDGRTDTRPF